jgi:hypothetical protein
MSLPIEGVISTAINDESIEAVDGAFAQFAVAPGTGIRSFGDMVATRSLAKRLMWVC